MSPRFASANAADCNATHVEVSFELIEGPSFFGFFQNISDVFFGELRKMARFSFRCVRCVQAQTPSMTRILAGCYIFQIQGNVVRLFPVLMVDEITLGLGSDETCGYKSMDEVCFPNSVVMKNDTEIAARFGYVKTHLSITFKAFYASRVGHFILSFIPYYWTPFFLQVLHAWHDTTTEALV